MKTRNYSPTKIRANSFDEEGNTIDIVWSTGPMLSAKIGMGRTPNAS